MKSRDRQMMVFMHMVEVSISQFCHDVIGRRIMKVAVIGRLLFCCLLFVEVCRFPLRSCMSRV